MPRISRKKSTNPASAQRTLPVLPASPLPPLYAQWMNEALAGPLPTEQDATCDQCVMLETAADGAPSSMTFFHPQTKCCTFLPELPNFLVGRVLADKRAEKGRASVMARMHAQIGVTPLGLAMPQQYRQRYEQGTAAFGQDEQLLCPHYLPGEGANCGLWQHRNATCATWFCKHERGATGDLFWRALLQLLAYVEQQLSHWCVLELNLSEQALALLFRPLGKGGQKTPLDAAGPDGQVNEAEYRALWGNWLGREAEFYQACAQRIEAWSWGDVVTHCGPALRAYWQLAKAAHAAVQSASLPARLQVGDFQLMPAAMMNMQAITYSSYDPLVLSPRLFALLSYFDGRPLSEVRQDILEQEQLTLNDALLRRLVDYGVLVAGD